MAHFQERRSGGDRRKFKGEDRRKISDRRNNRSQDIESVERAKYETWLAMTDRNIED